ncbi:Uncharacterised protein [Campylobacter hyointestinalis subsp. hyointestinalis]|uniref:RGS domain-containing protein n=1 Tax=Campylobacter hyointestinalis subsp. hyointestinalis TaxID=91352 RepID=A0A0S4SVP1_CAMHY|nr:hypothetical protein [Campylobacter hyointestinalis]CUU90480.1 Uncharacterised protein [Campylobacter hyointestinalis subsp. hyointestinalis]
MKLLTLVQVKDELLYQKTNLLLFKQLLENSISQDDISFYESQISITLKQIRYLKIYIYILKNILRRKGK